MANNGQFLNGKQQQNSFLHSNIIGSSSKAEEAAIFGINGSRGTAFNCSSICPGSSTDRQKHSIKRGKKEIRTVLNESQLKLLNQTYSTNQRPDTSIKEKLIEQTGLNARVIRVWFQNKRLADKKRQIEQREKLQNMEKNIEQQFVENTDKTANLEKIIQQKDVKIVNLLESEIKKQMSDIKCDYYKFLLDFQKEIKQIKSENEANIKIIKQKIKKNINNWRLKIKTKLRI
uniref:Homeobox domain-containing protein n=1 Tax=Meloidogyne enterolobii TaxID=390850 RepID=A0A6V7WWQ1_MELEN|nr:unnamed protein product [Meloidogyne enterolobii]